MALDLRTLRVSFAGRMQAREEALSCFRFAVFIDEALGLLIIQGVYDEVINIINKSLANANLILRVLDVVLSHIVLGGSL